MVDLYLNVSGNQVRFLSIPLDDIRRLSLSPLKWLQFLIFAVCGAHGDLLETVDGPVVDYNTQFNDLAKGYYYSQKDDFLFVDLNGANDRMTSSAQTACCSQFQRDVSERDGRHCLVSRERMGNCQAVHIIPQSKGDEYINTVVEDRSVLYPSMNNFKVAGINATENGLLLRNDLHTSFAHGEIAFLQTPNFAMDPSDVPCVENGPIPPHRVTMQYLTPPDEETRQPLPPYDLHFTEGDLTNPPALLLDYMYGVTAFKKWYGGPDAHHIMEKHFSNHYASIPPLPNLEPEGTETGSGDSNDPNDGDYEPRTPPTQANHDSAHRNGILATMDEMNAVLKYFSGVTPEEWTSRQQRKEEEERKTSQKKVQEWINSIPDEACTGSSSVILGH